MPSGYIEEGVSAMTGRDKREPEFYGRGVSLDGPRATIMPEEREAFDAGIARLIRLIREGRA